MTIEEILQQFTSKELREELRRRAMYKRKAMADIPRCRNCIHYGTVGYYGEKTFGKTKCCPYRLTRGKAHYVKLKPTMMACEHYKVNDE